MKKQRREYPPMALDDRFKFGKYKGRELWQVIRDDSDYVAWAMENLGLLLDNEAFADFEARRKVGR